MKHVLAVALAVVFLLFPSAEARQRHADIQVTSPPTMSAWSAKLTRQLGNAIIYPQPIRGGLASGFVRVRFSMNGNGTVNGMQLVKRSGSRQLDQAALQAVSKLSKNGITPTEVSASRPVEAHLFFAESDGDLQRLLAADKKYTNPANSVAASEKPILLASYSRTNGDHTR